MEKIRNFFLNNPKLDHFSEKAFLYLPFLFLGVNYFITIFFTLRFGQFTYDEFVVMTVAKQPLTQMFDTLLSEPHPPGFYLILHFLFQTLLENVQVKVAIITIGMLLFGGVTYYGFTHLRKRIPYLPIAVSLFFFTFGFSQIIGSVKQDVLSAPLLLFLLFLLIKNVSDIKHFRLITAFFIHFILFLIFWLGYIPFAVGGFFTILFDLYLFSKKKNFSFLFPLIIVLVTSSCYFLTFGYQQYQINNSRFGWINSHKNDFLSNISVFISGAEPQHFFTDLLLLSFFSSLIAVAYFWRKFSFKDKTDLFITFSFILILFVINYFFQLFVEFRYVWMSYFLLLSVTSAGLHFLRKSFLLFVLICFFLVRTAIAFRAQTQVSYATVHFLSVFEQEASTQKTGFISEQPLSPLHIKLQYFPQNSFFVPISPGQNSSLFFSKTTFTKDDLMTDGKSNTLLTDPNFFSTVNSQSISRIIYYNFMQNNSYIATHMSTYFLSHCEYEQTVSTPYGHSFMIFNHCQATQ